MRSILNRKTAPYVVRFFDVCFKQGVIDAHNYDDDIGAREFLDSKLEDLSFGILGKEEQIDWKVFSYELYWWARAAKLTTLAESYIYKLRKWDFYTCFLIYSMRFYLMGIQEWISYPVPNGIALFRQTKKIHWDPKAPNKRMTLPDIISYMHLFAYEYRKKTKDEQLAGITWMDNYCQAIHDLTRKYDTGKEAEDF